MTGIEKIAKEREEQILKHKRTVSFDQHQNDEFQLVDAATALADPVLEGADYSLERIHGDFPPIGWDKDIWLGLLKKGYEERLIIAGALIAAEIDRIN